MMTEQPNKKPRLHEVPTEPQLNQNTVFDMLKEDLSELKSNIAETKRDFNHRFDRLDNRIYGILFFAITSLLAVSYTHLRAHET